MLEILFRDTRMNSHTTYDFFRLLAFKMNVHYGVLVSDSGFNKEVVADIPPIVEMSLDLIAQSFL